MPYEIGGKKIVMLLALSGLLSGLLTCVYLPPDREEAGLYCGVLFGFFFAVPLAISGILGTGIISNLLRVLGLIAISAAAYLLASFIAIGIQMGFPQIVPSNERWDMSTEEPASATALFIGGLIGGLIVFTGLVFLSRSEANKGTHARKIILGTLLGGVLALIGWALRSSIGASTWHLLHSFGLTPAWELSPRQPFHGHYDIGQRSRMYSLYIVWQTGVAAAAGFMFRHTFEGKQHKSDSLQLFSPRLRADQ